MKVYKENGKSAKLLQYNKNTHCGGPLYDNKYIQWSNTIFYFVSNLIVIIFVEPSIGSPSGR